MLSSFSQYLQRNTVKSNSLLRLQELSESWFFELLDNFNVIAQAYPTKEWSVLGIIFNKENEITIKVNSRWEKLFRKYQEHFETKKDFINAMDNYFNFIMEKINSYFIGKFQSQSYMSEGQFFPLQAAQSGVEMLCRIRGADGRIVFQTNRVHSSIGSSERENIRKLMVKTSKAGGLPYLDKALKQLDSKVFLELAHLTEPHAEDLFYITEGEKLLAQVPQNFNNDVASDSCPVSLLIGARIEFIISSSPCNECQHYFQALRHLLNEKNITLPILIFAERPYNSQEAPFSIFSITQEATYQALPFPWNIKNKHLNFSQEPSQPLAPEYKAILTLNIFGEALLPRLVAKPTAITSFFHSLLEPYAQDNEYLNSHTLLDWLKFYYVEVLRALNLNLMATSLKEIMLPESYPHVPLSFIKESFFSTSVNEGVKLARYAHQKDNALLFFMRIFPKWEKTIYSLLKKEDSPSLDNISFDPNLKEFTSKIFKHIYWRIEEAPQELKREVHCFGEDKVVSISDPESKNLYDLVSLLGEVIHYANIAPQYRRRILNATLTHPDSPIADNYSYSDEEMAVIIFKTEKAIEKLCYNATAGSWKMDKLEAVHRAFRERKFPLELESQPLPTKQEDLNVQRLFSQSQAFEGFIRLRRQIGILAGDSKHVGVYPILVDDWKPFIDYLENDFSCQVAKKHFELQIIILEANKLCLFFEQSASDRRSPKNLKKIREDVLRNFVVQLNNLIGNLTFNLVNHGGFMMYLTGSPQLIQKSIQNFVNLSFIKKIYTVNAELAAKLFSVSPSDQNEEEFDNSSYDSLENVLNESRNLAEMEKHIGPREIRGWKLQDVEDKGNCFYDAVISQMQLLNHNFLQEVPEGTLPRDVLRLCIQGRNFKDREHADIKEIVKLSKKLNLVVAIVDTRCPEREFVYYYIDSQGKATHTNIVSDLPDNKQIIKIAFTGNHYLSVVETAYEVEKKSLVAGLSGFSFFKRMHKEFLTEHRHDNDIFQKEYDKQFGLVIRN